MNNILKRCLSIALALTIVFGSVLTCLGQIDFINLFNGLGVKSQAVTGGTCGENLVWTLEDGTLTISGEGEMYAFDADVGAPWYSEYKNITSVVVENGVKTIGDFAFCDCTELNNIILPDNLTGIGEMAFYNTAYYTTPSNWSEDALYIDNYFIEWDAFKLRWCSQVREGTTLIAEKAYNNSNTLKSVILPDSVKYINSNAFEYSGITSIILPENVVIDVNGFTGCNSLKNVYYRGLLTDWDTLSIESGNDSLKNATVSHICTYNNWSLLNSPTCSEWGRSTAFCEKCGESQQNEIIINSKYYPESQHDYSPDVNEYYEFSHPGAKALKLTFSYDTYIEDGFDFINIYDCNGELFGRYTGFALSSATLYIPGDSFSIELTSDSTYCKYGFSFYSINAVYHIGEEIEPLGHSYSKNWTIDIEPGCTQPGSKSHHCVRCNDMTDITEIEPKGHSYSTDWIVDVEPGCTTNGSESRHCAVCGDKTDVISIKPIGHNYQIAENQTSHPHTSVYVCANCSDSQSSNGFVDTCLECNFTIEETSSGDYRLVSYNKTNTNVVIPDSYNGKKIVEIGVGCFSENSSIESIAIPETIELIESEAFAYCSKLKYVFYSGDNNSFADILIGAANTPLTNAVIHYNTSSHIFADRIDVNPTCTNSGTKCQVCTVCFYIGGYITIPATGHAISDEWTIDNLPTCTDNGSKSHHCLNCSYKTDITEIAALGHNFGDWDLVTAPTCVEKGVAVRVCGNCQYEQCDEEYTNLVIDSSLYPESSHNYGDNINEVYEFSYDQAKVLKLTFSASTFTEPDADYIYIYDASGELYGKYTGAQLSGVTIELPGDSFTIKLTSDSNYGRYGFSFKSIVADFCNLDMVNILEHSYSEEWIIDVKPTCTENGSKSHHCSNCGGKFDVTFIEPDGHTYVCVDTTTTHPHTTKYECLVCQNEKTENVYSAACFDCNFTVAQVDDNSYKLVSYIGKQSDVVIPDTYNGKPITKIENNCFKDCTTIKTVTIPDSVTAIGNAVFYGCTNLDSITLSDSVTTIGNAAFFSCTNLSFVILPENVISVGNAVFRDCKALSFIVFSGKMTAIGLNAFDGCNSLDKVYFSGSETEWSNVTIANGNTALKNATFYFDFVEHPYVDVIDRAPTCTEDGLKHKVCTVCGHTTEGEVVPALGHSYTGEWKIDLAPTCTDAGRKSNCCSVCGNETTVVVSATGHNYSEEWIIDIEATCTEEGQKSRHCSTCGDKIDVIVIEALGHDYTDWIVDAESTCVDNGSKHKTCSLCNDVVTENISATGHSYCDWVVTAEPDCTNNGSKYKICSICNDTLTETIPSNGHDYSEEWTIDVAPSCTEIGSKSHHCTQCSDVTDLTIIPATGHSFGDWFVTIPPTCTEKGSKSKTCSVCNDVVTETIPENAHDYSTEWTIDTEVSCTEDGSKSHHCINCDAVTDITVIPATGHSYGDWFVTIPTTCTEEGSKCKTCSVCNDVITETIPANGHDYSTEWTIDVEATCTEDGIKYHHCINCDAVTDITVIPATGHSYGDWFVTVVPTCTEGGSKYRTCSVCSNVATQTIDANGHDYSTEWIIDVEATCTEAGSKSHHCNVCGDKADITVIDAIGHNYSEWGYDVLPSCTGYGSRSKTCCNCYDKIWESVLPTGHYCSWEYNYEENTKTGQCNACFEVVTEPLLSTDVITFTLDSSGASYIVTSCVTDYSGEIIIPDTYNDLPVTAIETAAFRECTGITSVEIPDSVTRIGGSAFRNCTNLEKIRLSANVQNIPGAMLFGCTSLESIIIPDNIIRIDGYAFSNCTELKYVFYEGNENSWNNVTFGSNNDPLTTVPVHYSTTEHSYVRGHIDPTCVEDGSDHNECTVCGHKTDIVVIKALGHNYSDWNITTQPTCTENGQAERMCSICSYKQVVGGSVVVESSLYPESEHNYGDGISEWYDFSYEGAESLVLTFSSQTFTESNFDYIGIYNADGSSYGSYCGSSLSGKTITLQGDSFRINLTTDGSITKYGFSFDSIVANMPEADIINSLGHDYSAEWVIDVQPTCTEEGSKSHHCLTCGDMTDVTVITATGHVYSDWIVNSVASCETDGYKYKTCSVCGDVVTEETPAWGHSYTSGWVMDVEPTKTTEGSKSRHCTVCDAKTDILPVEIIDNITFTLDSTGTAYVVTSCDKDAEGEIVIPDTYSAFPVVAIATDAFRDCTKITFVGIPDSVTSIGGSAFRNCLSLKEIKLSANTPNIPGAMLFGCKKLETVVIPDGIQRIDGYAFANCLNIKYVFYEGDESAWANVSISSNNTSLTDVSIHYNSTGEHSYSGEWTIDVAPTCIEEGSQSHHCLICDHKTDITSIDATGHSFCVWGIVKLPTCTDNGVAERNCLSCGFVDTRNGGVIQTLVDSGLYPESNHNYGNNISEWYSFEYNGAQTLTLNFSQSTCVESNYDYIYIYNADGILCGEYTGSSLSSESITLQGDSFRINLTTDVSVTNYGFSFDSIVAEMDMSAFGHNYSTEWTIDVEATCTEDGSQSHHCLICDEKSDVTVIPAFGHSYCDWNTDLAPTCTVNGSRSKNCSVCGDTIIESIAALGHDFSSEFTVDIEATCTGKGVKSRHCLRCDSKTDIVEILPTGHFDSDWIVGLDATCITDGYKYKECTVCKTVVENAVISAKGHTVVIDEAVSPDCINSGLTEGSHCFVCDAVIVQQTVIPAKGHLASEWIIDEEATCTTTGLMHKECLLCFEILIDTEIAALGHSYGDWIISEEPSCDEDGSRYKICSICDDIVTETLFAFGHDYSEEWIVDIEPTCIEQGSKSHHCSVCGNKSDVTVIEANGHSYVLTKVMSAHPHTENYCCSVCDNIKEESAFVDECLECNYTMTPIGSDYYKLVLYNGTKSEIIIPETYNGKIITAIGNGCYRENYAITSVKIPDTITTIGSIAFMNCTSLKEIYIPSSVTSIGANVFYGINDLVIFCEKDSIAHKYAIDNDIDFVLTVISETEGTTIDYERYIIRTTIQNCEDITEILNISTSAIAIPTASYIYGDYELYGTGTIITVFDGAEFIGDFTLIVEGDTNGDSVCDALDCFNVERASNGNMTLSGAFAEAGDMNADNVIDAADYQGIINIAA